MSPKDEAVIEVNKKDAYLYFFVIKQAYILNFKKSKNEVNLTDQDLALLFTMKGQVIFYKKF